MDAVAGHAAAALPFRKLIATGIRIPQCLRNIQTSAIGHSVGSAKGNVKTLSFDGQFVTIAANRSLIGAISGGSELRFPIRAISLIEWSDAAMTKPGFIRINMGGSPLRGSVIRPAFLDAAQDSNSVVFNRTRGAAFGVVRNEIENAMAAVR